MRRWWIMLGLVVAAVGCKGGDDADGPPAASTEAPALTRVTADRTDLLFRYPGDDPGAFETASSVEEVPAAKRAKVQVVDLSQPPEARGAGRFVQVFDLRAPGPDGAYPGKLVARAELEQVLAEQTARPAQASVTMYSASWCGVCRKARAFLEKEGVPFVEKDIEKDKGAQAELTAKAQKAGVQVGGVPVFDVGGRILPGFDPDTLMRAVRGG
ncbi:MAG: hypothetical protein KC583_22515 [Myxococcales bacterium]|nr:hypothetical protein [Myxococcales bacterium]